LSTFFHNLLLFPLLTINNDAKGELVDGFQETQGCEEEAKKEIEKKEERIISLINRVLHGII